MVVVCSVIAIVRLVGWCNLLTYVVVVVVVGASSLSSSSPPRLPLLCSHTVNLASALASSLQLGVSASHLWRPWQILMKSSVSTDLATHW